MRPVRIVSVFVFTALPVVLPASAAATVSGASVTGTDGATVRMSDSTAATIRNLAPTVRVTPQPNSRQRFVLTASGPDGGPAGSSGCIDEAGSLTVAYRGNGVYPVTVVSYSDAACSVAVGDPQVFSYRQVADAQLTAPRAPFLIRDQGAKTPRVLTIAVRRSLGGAVEIRSVREGQPTPDGAFSGASDAGTASFDGSEARLTFSRPGRYAVVARQSDNGFSTPWGPPAIVQAVAPFELSSMKYPDRSGPMFKFRAIFRDAPVAGASVSVEIGKGARGAFRPAGTVAVQPDGSFSMQFQRSPGSYRMRFFFTGDETVARGYRVVSFKVRGRRLAAG